MSVTVRETIQHGADYLVTDTTAPTREAAIEAALAASPYNRHAPADNAYRRACVLNVIDDGRGHLGWADYEIIKEEP